MMLLDGREPVSEYERIKGILTDFFATKTKADLLDAAMTRRVLITPVWSTGEVCDSEQLAFRQYWEDVDHSDVVLDAGAGSFDPAAVRYPGAFAKYSETPLAKLGRPPRLGEHTDEVLAELDAAGAARTPSVPISVRDVADAASITAPPLEGVEDSRLHVGDGWSCGFESAGRLWRRHHPCRVGQQARCSAFKSSRSTTMSAIQTERACSAT